MSGIEGKVVAITGASSGIGAATARLLAERGARVVLGARRVERLEDVAGQIHEAGGRAVTCRADVARRSDVQRLVGTAVDQFDRLDVLVSNAGMSKIGPISDLDVDGWADVVLREQIRSNMNDFGIPPGRSRERSRSPSSSPTRWRSVTSPSVPRFRASGRLA
ncbi:SDR family oxidoreductase [Mycobacterium sp. Aquia_216]|uniref:SDR family oxidoreductase n=1 Tax=Mycobacterium sp. Aquia_216 TaxID=2991729 RepID=UPI002DD640F3|nr:SDR family NAD(P)-dependent oxidoreductase [Mycobacterium sp. Aquia_216]